MAVCTDGACLGNPGPGGWAAVLSCQGKTRELSGGYRLTTNNRMELLGLIRALESLQEPCDVTATTDSRYLHDAIDKGWLKNWQKKGWVTAERKPVKNQDLWRALDALLKIHRVTFQWVRGHAGHAGNERCDQLASQAARRRDLPADEGYVK